MATDSTSTEPEATIITLPVARSKALTVAVMWSLPAMVFGVATVTIYRGLNFRPSGISNRLVDYGLAIVAAPIALLALYCAAKALQRLLLCVWPAPLGAFASADALVFRLGPLGARSFDAARLDILYPFEFDAEGEGSFEAFLPKEEQLERMLPRIVHPDTAERLDLVIRRHSRGSEAELAATLRPLLDLWRVHAVRGDSPGGAE